MKKTVSLILLLQMLLFQAPAFADRGSSVGNGGNDLGASFVAIGRTLLNSMKTFGQDRFPEVEFDVFEKAIEQDKVVVVTTRNQEGRVVENFPDQSLFKLYKHEWKHAQDKLTLVLHEYLGIMGVEKSESYATSTELISRLHDLMATGGEIATIGDQGQSGIASDVCLSAYLSRSAVIHNRNMKIAAYSLLAAGFLMPMVGEMAGLVDLDGTLVLGLVFGGAAYGQIDPNAERPHWNKPGRTFVLLNDVSTEKMNAGKVERFLKRTFKTYRDQTYDTASTDEQLTVRTKTILLNAMNKGLFCKKTISGTIAVASPKEVRTYVLNSLIRI